MEFPGGSSPLFMPQGTPEGNAFPSQRENGSGRYGSGHKGKGRDMGEGGETTQSNPQRPYKRTSEQFWADWPFQKEAEFWKTDGPDPYASPDVKEEEESSESSFSPSPSPSPPKQRARYTHKFAPLTSHNERLRLRHEAAQQAAAAAAVAEGAPNTLVANTALAEVTRQLGHGIQMAELAARQAEYAARNAKLATENASMHHNIAKHALGGDAPRSFATANNALRPDMPQPPAAGNHTLHPNMAPTPRFVEEVLLPNLPYPPTTDNHPLFLNIPHPPVTGNHPLPPRPPVTQSERAKTDPLYLIQCAHHHLENLASNLRRQENDACDREEHLSTMLEQAREIREHAIQDRRNGLVIIRDRERKVSELERRLRNREQVNGEEMLELLKPLNLAPPIEKDASERMNDEEMDEDEVSEPESVEYWSG